MKSSFVIFAYCLFLVVLLGAMLLNLNYEYHKIAETIAVIDSIFGLLTVAVTLIIPIKD